MEITGAGTIDDLVADAEHQGHHVTGRLVTDWVSNGLLDRPARRPKGRGQGSAKALYSAHQRELFLSLLDKRSQGAQRVSTLARVPIFIWLGWGDDYVPTRQALLAMSTWLGDAKASKERARFSAGQILGQLDHPDARAADRRALKDLLADIAWKGRVDDPEALRSAVQTVFEPVSVFKKLERAVGHPWAPLTADSVFGVLMARWTAASALRRGKVSEHQMAEVRQMYLASRAEYNAMLPTLTRTAQPYAELYADGTIQAQVDSCAVDVLTLLGFQMSRAASGGAG